MFNTPPLSMPGDVEILKDGVVLFLAKSFGANVHFHVICGDVLDVNQAGVVYFAEPVIQYVNVFGSLLKDWVSGKSDGTLIVDKHLELVLSLDV